MRVTVVQAAERWWSHFLESNNTLIAETFSGQLRSRVKCTMCGTTSDTFDPFFDLSLPLERAPRLSLHTCVESFFDEEILGQPGHQHYFCEVCKQKRRATKQLSITHVPTLLLVHLKRYSSMLSGVRTTVDVQMRLNKGEWMDKKARGRNAFVPSLRFVHCPSSVPYIWLFERAFFGVGL
ncbi:unnamed protein product [Vitrella brassicaformis CCMP3155]|uniref:USP domain-containing protein n=1 Tax=Vitrella brassicaformis (strain CCMP3155) TaxID=1169540 RepID=A0A0G4ESG3_VITBC|nr:unnamed protein product [Vitrella brassicaformis CCMP3155]|eukprot:CEM00931.1 unnamed protein product [Vitrella brassicaformis CCMP3155]